MHEKRTTMRSYRARLDASFRFLSSSNSLAVLSSISLSLSAASLFASSKSAWVFNLSFSTNAYNTPLLVSIVIIDGCTHNVMEER